MKIKREDFLRALESVKPGLSKNDVIQQSSCFVFRDGMVWAFNDEVCCRAPLDLGVPDCAVAADKLVAVLSKLPEGVECSTSLKDGHLVLQAGKRKMGVAAQEEVLLALGEVDPPGEWSDLHADFCEALTAVGRCAGRDVSKFKMTCIHIAPDLVEAGDNERFARWPLETGFPHYVMAKHDGLRHAASLGVTQFSVTQNYVHFTNGQVVLSCRQYDEEYPDLDDYGVFKLDGEKVVLPKTIKEAVALASVFSDDVEEGAVSVTLSPGDPGTVTVAGHSPLGFASHTKNVFYDGREMTFLIKPKTLTDLLDRHNECVVSDSRLLVDAGQYLFMTCLALPKNKEPKGGEGEGDSDEADA